jgi:diguanylate cyclase (GGDEF)-like protein
MSTQPERGFAGSGAPSVKAKVLLVEDSRGQAALARAALEKRGYEVFWASSGLEGLRLALEKLPDVILLDLVLQDMDGFSVCRWLKLRPATRDIPVIMLTVRSETKDRVDGLQLGAVDYIAKPWSDEELEARVFTALRSRTAHLELTQRNSQLEAMLRRVEALALTDALTGLYNRRRFSDVLANHFAATRRYAHPLSCALLDIDHFKKINDRYGHDVGDRVLRAVAEVLSAQLREVDLAARYGGEEFAVVLPHTSKEAAERVAQRILEAIRTLRVSAGDAELGVTASFGVASSTDLDQVCTPEDLVRAADVALYGAKAAGRNRVVVYDSQMTEELASSRPPADP